VPSLLTSSHPVKTRVLSATSCGRAGRDGVASFFTDLAGSVEISAFTPHSFAAGQDDVHLLVGWTIRSARTGREASMTMHHYWRIRDGKATYFRGSEDTELTAQVFAA
jgi:ketosteroid isomerase-like protein